MKLKCPKTAAATQVEIYEQTFKQLMPYIYDQVNAYLESHYDPKGEYRIVIPMMQKFPEYTLYFEKAQEEFEKEATEGNWTVDAFDPNVSSKEDLEPENPGCLTIDLITKIPPDEVNAHREEARAKHLKSEAIKRANR